MWCVWCLPVCIYFSQTSWLRENDSFFNHNHLGECNLPKIPQCICCLPLGSCSIWCLVWKQRFPFTSPLKLSRALPLYVKGIYVHINYLLVDECTSASACMLKCEWVCFWASKDGYNGLQNYECSPGRCRHHKSSPLTSPLHQRESPCELMSGALPTACLKWDNMTTMWHS